MNGRLLRSGILVAVAVIAALRGVVALAIVLTGPGTADPGTAEGTPTPSAATVTESPVSVEPSSGESPAPSLLATVPPVATSTREPAATPSPTPSPADLIAAFMPQLADALRTGDAAFQIAHLHPDTLARYGGAQCLQELSGRADPTISITVVEIGPPEAWDYETDGLATKIEEAVPVTVDMTMDGVAARRVLHVTVDAGVVRWFTDCGLPTDTPGP
jgi:hypothetical protein